MPNENLENQTNQPNQPNKPLRNPSRDNERSIKEEERSEEQLLNENESNREPEVQFGEDRKEVDLDRNGVGSKKGQGTENQKQFSSQADGVRTGQEQGKVGGIGGKNNPLEDKKLKH